jgi:hypothetical protein
MCVEMIVLLQTGFEGRVCQNTGTEFLKMHTYPVQSMFHLGAFFRDVMNSRTSSIEENTLSLLRELQG